MSTYRYPKSGEVFVPDWSHSVPVVVRYDNEVSHLGELTALAVSPCFCRLCGEMLRRARPRKSKFWQCNNHPQERIPHGRFRKEQQRLKRLGLL